MIAAAALVIGLIGLPKCSEYQTEAKAEADHRVLSNAHDSDMEYNEAEHHKMWTEIREMRKEAKEDLKEILQRLPQRRRSR
jgi:hypothetical protein